MTNDTKITQHTDAHGHTQSAVRVGGKFATKVEREGAAAPLSFADDGPVMATPATVVSMRAKQLVPHAQRVIFHDDGFGKLRAVAIEDAEGERVSLEGTSIHEPERNIRTDEINALADQLDRDEDMEVSMRDGDMIVHYAMDVDVPSNVTRIDMNDVARAAKNGAELAEQYDELDFDDGEPVNIYDLFAETLDRDYSGDEADERDILILSNAAETAFAEAKRKRSR